ncbi:MAG: ABC transporter permease [Lewinellaceae bacterium]|nr:ABC transporter permease [Lewinellaceae bacterium]
MFLSIFLFELRYRLRRPATYVYFFALLALTALIIANGGLGISEKVHYNAPVSISLYMTILGIYCVLISSAVMGVPLYRDIEHQTKEYLLSTPVSSGAYFWGRFWGSFAVLVLISLGALAGYVLGSWLGPAFDWSKPERFGPNVPIHYFWPFLTIFLPSLFFTSCLFFGLVALTRNNRVLYSASILLFILYLLANFLVRDLENRDLVDFLDPFALNTHTNATKYLTPAEQNTQLVPLTGNLLWNRLLWTGVGLLTILGVYFRFNIQRFVSEASRGKSGGKSDAVPAPARVALPLLKRHFSRRLDWSNLWSLGKLEFGNIIRDTYFISIMLGAVIFLFLDDWIGNLQYGVPDRPLTMNMLLFKTYNYSLFVFILLMFYVGETVHRDRATRFDNIGDALPVPNWVQLGSKFVAIVGICVLLATIPMLVGVVVQVLHGFFNFKFGFYFVDLYLITFWDYLQMALLAFFVHALVNNKFVGHFVGLGIWIMMFVLRNFMDFGYNLGFYSYKPGYLISDMNNFGHFAQPLFWFNLYWMAFGFILLFVAALLWSRGAEQSFKTRWQNLRRRWNPRFSLGILALAAVWLGSGSFIYYNVSVVNKHYNADEVKKIQSDYEKRYKQYEFLAQPKLTDLAVYADIFPDTRSLNMRVVMKIQNKTDRPIDSLHLSSEDGQKYALFFDKQPLSPAKFDLMQRPVMTLFYEKPDTGGYRIFALPRILQPGDTATLEFRYTVKNPGFVNDGYRREVVANGTFSYGNVPTIGYDRNREMESDEDRKKYGLPEKPDDLPPHRDPFGERTLLFNDDADYISFECVVSTSPDQIAVAPGYLQREWTEGDRRYFHYKQDSKTDYFFTIVSARYEVLRDKWTSPEGKDVNIEIFYHREHAYNLDRFVASLKDGLTYFHKHFGPYQFRQARVLEFPRYAAFAQSFPNTIPYSEDFGWYADFSDPNDYDYGYYVTAHELAHQWWGHQVVPNLTRGSNLISESLAEYSALMIAKEKYGPDNVQQFLKYDLDRYLRGRAGESKKEHVFLNCNRPYQWYQKGSIILYALQDYVGEAKLNGAIRAFRDSFGLKETPPFPGSYDLYDFIKKVTPDSLHYYLTDTWEKITLYENRVLSAKARKLADDRYEVTLQVKARKMYADEKGNETEAPGVNDYLDIGVFADDKVENGKKLTQPLYLQKHRLTAGEHTIVLTVSGKPVRAGIDPYNKMIDRVPEDNRIEVEMNDE